MMFSLLLIVPILAAIGTIFLRQVRAVEALALFATGALFVDALFVAGGVVKGEVYTAIGAFSSSAASALFVLVIAFLGLAAAAYSVGYLREEVSKGIIGFRRVRQYFALFHAFIFAMCFALLTNNPILMWIAVEATTLSTAFLISFYHKPSGLEAAWKYLIVNSVGLLLGFFGTLLFFTALKTEGTSGLVDWQALMESASSIDPLVAKMAFVFVLIGYGTKVGLVPMHTWKPDAYSKVPTPIAALFSGALMNVAFFAILKLRAVADISAGPEFSANMLILFGTLSVLISAFIIFIQKNYKRMLAYSSVEHAGIIALGFGFGGLGAYAAVLHMVYHAIAKAALFFAAGNIFLKYSSTKIDQVKGVISTIPVSGAMFVLGFLAVVGMPPFGMFATEVSIFLSGIAVHPVVAAVAIAGLAIAFAGFLKRISAMTFGDVPPGIAKGESNPWTVIPVIVLVVVLFATGVFLPSGLVALAKESALIFSL